MISEENSRTQRRVEEPLQEEAFASRTKAPDDSEDTSDEYDDEPQDEENVDNQRDDDANKIVKILQLPLSKSLLNKLQQTAHEEGISIEELAKELLCESLVVRAWEINNRNMGARPNTQGGHQQGNQQKHHGQKNFNQKNQRHGKGGRNHMNNLNIMQDKAAFIEYVRNQERKRR